MCRPRGPCCKAGKKHKELHSLWTGVPAVFNANVMSDVDATGKCMNTNMF